MNDGLIPNRYAKALYAYAKEQGEFEVAFGIAAILVALTLILNVAARLVGAYFKKKRA